MTRLCVTLAAGAAVLVAAVVFIPRQSSVREAPVAASPAVRKNSQIVQRPISRSSYREVFSTTANPLDLPPPAQAPHAGSPAYEEWLDSRIEELEALAWLDDAESLQKILAEIRSSVPEIRAAAIDATREFGSRDAVPYLQTIVRETPDSAESRRLADLIEYLNLPTMVEQADGDVVE